MLDRTKIIKELAHRSGELSDVVKSECDYARRLWQKIANDEQFHEQVSSTTHRFAVPSWNGLLSNTQKLEPCSLYEVLAIDGSQIYPDRHQGTSCFLINIGIVQLRYSPEKSSVVFETIPYVALEGDKEIYEYTPEIVNAYRTEHELQTGRDWMSLKRESNNPQLFLFDGSLIFWYVYQAAGSPPSPQNAFFARYLALLEEFFELGHTLAGYISYPKSRDLINLLRIAAEQEGTVCDFAHMNDSTVANFFLEPGCRSALFESNAPVVAQYPEHSCPYFFYLNTGNEIARIELPAWMALNNQRLNLTCQIIIDQVEKGNGYPVSLAEAHEQAVITHADKDFSIIYYSHSLQVCCHYRKKVLKSVA